MRRSTALITSALLLGGAFAGAPAASAHNRGEDFTLKARFTDWDERDRGRRGASEGDVVSFALDLWEHRHGEAGTGDGDCRLVEVNRGRHNFEARCTAVFDLDDGRLRLKGTVTDEDFDRGRIVLRVVDGSGEYRNADGRAVFRPAHNRGRHHRGADLWIDVNLR